jgi:predicted NUDIX family NTP pyrophosphohydrolase
MPDVDQMTPREVEKLRAIGYRVERNGVLNLLVVSGPGALFLEKTEEGGWETCKAHAQSPEGRKATMAAKVDWLLANGHEFCINGVLTDGDSADFFDRVFWEAT